MLPGKGKNLLDLFLCLRLENEVGTTVEQEVPDEGRKVYVQVMAVVFEFIRLIQGLQVRVLSKETSQPLRTIQVSFHLP